MRAGACLLWVLSLAACGANVVVDQGTATGTSGDLSCAAVCMKTAAACPSTGTTDCVTSCVTTDKLGNATCPESYQAFLVCADAHPGSQCDGTNACNAEVTAFSSCLTQVCTADPTKCVP